MNINIKGTNLDLTEPIKAYATGKILAISKFLHKSGDEAVTIIELERTTDHHNKGEVYRTVINLTVSGKLYRAEVTNSDLYASIDLAKDELARELIGDKNRKETLFRRGARLAKRILRRN